MSWEGRDVDENRENNQLMQTKIRIIDEGLECDSQEMEQGTNNSYGDRSEMNSEVTDHVLRGTFYAWPKKSFAEIHGDLQDS